MKLSNALLMLGLYKLGYGKLNDNIVRECRISIKKSESDVLMKRYIFGDVDTSTEVYLLNCNSESDVINYIKSEGLSSQYVDPVGLGCTGRLFGGEPIISKVCEGRFKVKYVFCYDV